MFVAQIKFASAAGCFFFSSRRRHTRSKRDWSSDVCSSDLDVARSPRRDQLAHFRLLGVDVLQRLREEMILVAQRHVIKARELVVDRLQALHGRSEERRVGKEWRSRGVAYS